MLILLCAQRVCTWYLSTDKSHVQHMEELFKQGFPVKTHSGFPILAAIFFWRASSKAVCDRQPCRGHHFRELEVIQLLTSFILWQKHSENDLAIRKTQLCTVLPASWTMADPSWANRSGITAIRGKEMEGKVCFSYWLKTSKWEYSIIGSPWSAEGLLPEAINLRAPPYKPQCHSWCSASAQH